MERDLERWNVYGARAARAGIVVHAPDTSIAWANEEAAELLGISRADLSGKFAWDEMFRLVDREAKPLPLEQYPVVLTLERREPIEDYIVGWLRGESERPVWGKISARPVIEDGELVAVVVTFVDISDIVEAEEQRRGNEARLAEGQRLEALGLLAGGIAHDFNNLLVGILGAAEVARTATGKGESVDRMLDLVSDSALRARDLTRQLLAYAGRGSTVVEVLDLNAVVREMLRLTRGSLIHATIDFQPGEAPALEADGTRLRQVVLNLLTNASDAVSDTGRISVRTGTRSCTSVELAELGSSGNAGDFVTLTVSDDGIGMDQETLKRIFEPFFTTKPTGHGLGLAAMDGFVRERGGFLRVESEPGRGAVFTIGLPASRRHSAVPAVSRLQPRPLTEQRRAFVVDDDATVRQVLCEMLTGQGFEVEARESAKGLVEVLSADTPDVLFLDLTMPDLSGIDLLSQVRASFESLPIIIVSGHSDAGEVLVEPGVPTNFVAKPFTQAELAAALHSLL